jgi:hypothetical protein
LLSAEAANIPPPRGVVALDGKALRRGYERGMTHIPLMVSAWGAEIRMALANMVPMATTRPKQRSSSSCCSSRVAS